MNFTNDYKEILFNYLNGTFTPEEQPSNIPYWAEEGNDTNGLSDYLLTELEADTISITNFIQAKSTQDTGSEFQVAYGTYIPTGTSSNKYFLIVLNNKLEPINLFTTYSSEVELNKLIDLEVAEDETFYGIEQTSGGYRYIQFNNMCVPINGVYQLRIRDTANITTADRTISGVVCDPVKIRKKVGESFYGIGLEGGSGSSVRVGVLTLKVDLGSNEFNLNPYNGTTSGTITDVIVYQRDNDDFNSFRLLVDDFTNNNCILFVGNENGAILGSKYTMSPQGTTYQGAKLINENYGYCVSSTGSNVYSDRFTTSMTGDVASIDTSLPSINYIELKVVNGEVFFLITTPGETEELYAGIGHIIEGAIYIQMFSQPIIDYFNVATIGGWFVSQQFNLLNAYVQSENDYSVLIGIYNANNYNGFVPYNDFTSFDGKSGILENDIEGIVFARNTTQQAYSGGNVLTYTLNVPNIYLNNIDVNTNELYGGTSNKMISENVNWQKNIYENVNVNFINQFVVNNELNENPVVMSNASNTVANSVNNAETNYSLKQVSKYQIVYEDDTTEERHFTSTIYTGQPKTKIHLMFYNDNSNPVKKINIISEDTQTTYANIDIPNNLNTNTYYSLTLDMSVN